jgi:hypothetical protein
MARVPIATGPIFLFAAPCARGGSSALPEILRTSPDYPVKGYGTDDRIVYDTEAVVAQQDLHRHAADLLQNPRIVYLHVRSARNDCDRLRIDRSQPDGLAQ